MILNTHRVVQWLANDYEREKQTSASFRGYYTAEFVEWLKEKKLAQFSNGKFIGKVKSDGDIV